MAHQAVENALNWMEAHKAPRSFYSMIQRLGQVVNGREGYDCSSSVYFALRSAGIFPAIMGNTTTMLTHLPQYGWYEVGAKPDGTIDAQRGDIFLWDVDGTGWSNAGGGKHTGMFVDVDNIIHANYSYNGISVNNHDAYYTAAGVKQLRVFRYGGSPAPKRKVSFARPFAVEERATVNDIDQMRLAGIVQDGFDWTDNGVPVSIMSHCPEYEGNIWRINGEFEVLREEVENGAKYLNISLGSIGDIWVWERALNNPIDLRLKEQPQPQPQPEPTPAPTEPAPEPIPEPQPPIEEKTPENTGAEVQKEEKNDMSHNDKNATGDIGVRLTDKEFKMLEDLQKEAVKNIGNTEYEPRISEKTKTTVYFVADLGILVNMLIATICVILIPTYTKEILAISGAVATALAGLKPIFKLGAKK